MNNSIYVFGHKNPDTDSVVSATAFAYLKNKTTKDSYKACRAGKLNPQTDYIYKKFGVTPPEFIPDLNPKVRWYMNEKVECINQMTSFWEASVMMRKSGRKAMPVVDDNGVYKAILNYNSFSKNIFEVLNPAHHISVFTDINLMQKTLNAKVLNRGFEGDELHKYTIISGATSFDSFKKTLEEHSDGKVVVVTGDREDIQTLCVEKGISALVLSADRVPSDSIIQQAQKSGTSIIVSSYDTASTSMLILYSTPVRVMGDHSVKPVHAEDAIQKVAPLIKKSVSRVLPVVDSENRVTGILSELDLHHEPKIQVALVDHNELSQAVDGIENYKITDIVDHHRIGSPSTKYPISFINLPLGSTSTIITKLFIEQKVELPQQIARLLLCGILSDTLILKSATTTETDVQIADYLSTLTKLDYKALGEEIIRAGSRISGRSAEEIVNQDMKEYREGGKSFTVSQIEVDGTDELMKQYEKLTQTLQSECRGRGALFSALLVTDISSLSSIMIIWGEEKFLQTLNFPRVEENAFELKGVVSRKKQLIPMLTELLQNSGD